MAFLIRTIAVAKSGREIPRDRTLDVSELTVGRAPDCDIHLADLTVELQHLSLSDSGSGMLRATALGELPFTLDGSSTTEATINAGSGAIIEVGPARLEISRESGGPIQIIQSQIKKSASAGEPTAGFAMASAMPSKRTMAWAMSLAILVLLLAVPIVTHLTRDTSFEGKGPDAPRYNQVSFDSTWSSGDLSLAHHDLKDNCEACHSTPFVSVQDTTCLTCHEELGDHAEKPRLMDGMAPIPAGEAWQWAVAESLGKEGPGSCTSCHLEHEGKLRQQAATQQFCADCHQDLDARLTDVAFSNADNFGEKHPQFRPTFYTEYNQEDPVRVSLDRMAGGAIEEKSGLIFPHDIHMDENSGVARMAISLSQYGEPLECSNCHELTDDKVGYKPVEMEPACEACHSLVAGRDATGGFTSLRHGDVADLMEDLKTMGKGPKRAVVTGRERPGAFAQGGSYAINFGRPTASLIAINRALLPGGTCGDCHLPTRTDGRPDLVPVNLPDRFLMHGHFTHVGHEEEECTDCHEADTSKNSTDLLMPALESCQDCHKGESAVATEEIVPSSCAMCHGYHTPTAPWPGDHPILQSTPEGNRVKSADSIASISAMLKE